MKIENKLKIVREIGYIIMNLELMVIAFLIESKLFSYISLSWKNIMIVILPLIIINYFTRHYKAAFFADLLFEIEYDTDGVERNAKNDCET